MNNPAQQPKSSTSSAAAAWEAAVTRAHGEVKQQLLDIEAPSADSNVSMAFYVSTRRIEGYATLDVEHLKEVEAIASAMRLYAVDPSRRRPLNFLLHADPGSGKSHFVECLATKLAEHRVRSVSFNMTAMQTTADLAEPIDRIRDLKVADKVPLLFLDEFDSNVENYARLLPLMWDGKVDVGGRLLQTGKMIVVLAGSSPRIGELTEAARQMNDISKPTDGKLNDLLSRINGGELSIPALDEVLPPTRDRRVDKICLAIALIRQRFGKSLSHIPWALLRFVGDTKFKNGSRSISSLLELIPRSACTSGSLNLADLKLPLGSAEELTKSSLIYHISASTPGEVTNTWQRLAQSSSMVKVADPDSFWTRLFEHVSKDSSFKALIES